MKDLEREHPDIVCDETRHRAHGYQLRCREPLGHHGEHRWTPELVVGSRDEG